MELERWDWSIIKHALRVAIKEHKKDIAFLEENKIKGFDNKAAIEITESFLKDMEEVLTKLGGI